MFVNAIRMVRASFKLTWVTATIALIGLVALPHLVGLVGRELYVVGGGSMEPAIPLGAAVIVRPIATGELRVGDVITFRGVNGTVITHRIVGVPSDAGGSVQTKGDANGAVDPSLVTPLDVIGSVDIVIPVAGGVLTTLATTLGLVATLALLGGLLVAVWFMDELIRSVQRPVVNRKAIVWPQG